MFGAALASLPSLQTRVIAFDTAVVDLTEQLDDPVDVLFGMQLGGGTDIDRALGYCQSLVAQPGEDRPDPGQRPLRGRRSRIDAAPRRRACCAPACG